MQTNRRKFNVFVIGLDDFNLKYLQTVPEAEQYTFHRLLGADEIVPAAGVDMRALLARALDKLCRFPGRIDVIAGFGGVPSLLMAAILRRQFALGGPSLEGVLKCEHKYWSRLEQSRIIPEHVPSFELVDPFDYDALHKLNLEFPFWLKPIDAHSSLLGFRIRNKRDFEHGIAEIRAGINRFAEPFDAITSYARLPGDISSVNGRFCIAEEIISSGRQCTLEGYSCRGNVKVYGVVDSVRGSNRSSMERYEYPSRLPPPVRRRMAAIARRFVSGIGLEDSPFNMEFFYDGARDHIWVLEINSNIHPEHAPLFERVDGISQNQVMLDIALGRNPELSSHSGGFRHAAGFMPRAYGYPDVTAVADAPSPAELHELEQRFPGTEIRLHVNKGWRLGDSPYHDSYSTVLASIFMGANSHHTLMQQYHECMRSMHIRLQPVNESCHTRCRMSA